MREAKQGFRLIRYLVNLSGGRLIRWRHFIWYREVLGIIFPPLRGIYGMAANGRSRRAMN